MGADKKVRGSKLGDIYDKGGITHGFEAEKQRRRKYESKSTTPERTPKDQSTHRQPGTTLNWSSFDQSTQALFNERKRRERAERAEREAREQDDRARAERAKQIESESTISKRTKGFDLEL